MTMLGHALLLGSHLKWMTTLTWAGQSQRAQLQAGLQVGFKTRRSTRTLFDLVFTLYYLHLSFLIILACLATVLFGSKWNYVLIFVTWLAWGIFHFRDLGPWRCFLIYWWQDCSYDYGPLQKACNAIETAWTTVQSMMPEPVISVLWLVQWEWIVFCLAQSDKQVRRCSKFHEKETQKPRLVFTQLQFIPMFFDRVIPWETFPPKRAGFKIDKVD